MKNIRDKRTSNIYSTENNENDNNIKEQIKKYKKEYQVEISKYRQSSTDIIDNEKSFNEISKKLNKLEYKKIEISNKIDDNYINQLNEYRIDPNKKNLFLTLLGFPFPDEEPFYFDSPESLVAQLSLSKDYLFELEEMKEGEFNILKNSYESMSKNEKELLIIYHYTNLNFESVNFLKKRKKILEKNAIDIKNKDIALVSIKKLEKKIKEGFMKLKQITKHGNLSNNSNPIIFYSQKLKEEEKDDYGLNNNSHLLSVREFDEISGKSFIMSLSNDNTILDLFNEEESKNVNSIDDNIPSITNSIEREEGNKIPNILVNKNNFKAKYKISKSPEVIPITPNVVTDGNQNIKEAKIQKAIMLINKYRSPQNKIIKGKQGTLKLENNVSDSGCCASCT